MITDIHIWPIKSDDDERELEEAAYDDGDRTLLGPTHMVCKEEKIIGAFCTASPTVHWWMDSRIASTRDSRMAFQSLDTLMREQGTPDYLVVCEESSPYYKLMTQKCELVRPMQGRDWSIFRQRR